MMSEVEKLCFWTGFLTGRHFKAIPTLLKLGPLSTLGLERLRTAAKERNAWALERLASLLQGV